MTTTFYKLHHSVDQTKECYVGSTSNFAIRKSNHKSVCNNANSKDHNLKVYRYIRSNGGFSNWKFTVLEQRDNLSKKRKLMRERVLTERHGCTLNMCRAGAMLEAGGMRALNRQGNDTDNICDRCDGMYRGNRNRTHHQKTKKCIRLTAQRAQPLVVNINIVVNQ